MSTRKEQITNWQLVAARVEAMFNSTPKRLRRTSKQVDEIEQKARLMCAIFG